MEHIKLTQTQTFSTAGSAISGSTNNQTSMPAAIDERLIIDEILGV